MIELNKIYNETWLETFKRIPDDSIDLIVTSPPYNKGYWSENRNLKKQGKDSFLTKSRRITYGDFDDNLDPKEYEDSQRTLLSQCVRVIKPTGSIFYNHIDILNRHLTIHPKYVYDFPLKQVIVWDRKSTPKLDESYFLPVNEYIFWIKKNSESIPKFYREKALMKKNIWSFGADINNDHPAPFPLKLVFNCILATTDEGDTVYDPHMGSGTTAIACIDTNRNYIGSEMIQEFCKDAENRIKNYIAKPKLFGYGFNGNG